MTLLEKIGLICGISIILFPIVVFATAMVMDAIFEYFDDKWVNEGEKERSVKSNENIQRQVR